MLGSDDTFEKDYVGPRGAKFKIQVDRSGFFFIHMVSGGVRPAMCEDRFTTRKQATRVLENYFKRKPEITPRAKTSKKD